MIVSTAISILAIFSDLFFFLKWLVSYVILWISKKRGKRRFELYDELACNDPVKLGFIYPEVEKALESPCSESHLEKASDEVFIYGVSSGGECVIVRIARGGNEESEAWIYLKMKDGRTYRLMDTLGYERNFGDGGATFSCGGLQMYWKAPMRSWRIFFNGMLWEEKNGEKDSGKRTFVKFAFQWKASSDAFDMTTDMSTSSVADALARAEWKYPYLPPTGQLPETFDIYCQSGVMTGVVTADNHPDCEMYLFGEKVRYRGKSSYIVGSKFKQLLGSSPENGFVLHVGVTSAPNIFHKLPFGFAIDLFRHIKPVEDVHIITKLYAPENLDSSLSASFSAGKSYELTGTLTGDPILFKSKKGWEGHVEMRYVEFKIGQKYRGSGVLITGEVLTEPNKTVKKQPLKLPETIPVTVAFSEEISGFSEVSGGKGGSLGKLTKLSSVDKTFTVPKGITVTTSAYQEFLTPQIVAVVKDLENVVYGKVEGDVAAMCEKVSATVVESKLPNAICEAIKRDLSRMFKDRLEGCKFAVRSSATGEDTEQMSAAGQMDTFLGVQGLEEIYQAVKKCWASQFGFIAVEYKRRNGQVLNCPMAVVIQEMADCEVAGVLFTCDPLTNNPSLITITGNYGLGESVVSGSEEPDTVVLRRESDVDLAVESVTVGAKQRRIVMQDGGGVVTEEVPEEARQECCISNDMAVKLGQLAIKIEKYYRSPRDIEWGIRNSTLYILQSRPVTSGAAESDFEIKHEFDGPLSCEREYHTVSNVGEVMPGATSPLGLDLTQKTFGTIFRRDSRRKGIKSPFHGSYYYPTGMLPFCNHSTMCVTDLLIRLDSLDSMMSKATMIGVFGRLLDDPDVIALAQDMECEQEKKPLKAHLHMIKNLFFGMYGLENAKRRFDSVTVPKCGTAKELLKALLDRCSDYDDGLSIHMNCSEASMTWNILLFLLLGKNKSTFDTDVYSDFARLLSSASNVESADVPAAMQNLSHYIVQEIKSEDFKSMAVEDAASWLQNSTSLAGHKFRQFLKRHGHRCLKEFDVHSIPWETDPKPLVKLLQNLSGSCEKSAEKKDEDYQKIFSELKTPLDFKSRCLIRFLLPNSRRAVGEREQCKSVLIKGMHIWRQGFVALSKLMVSEGRIPDTNLIFFMTINEIIDLLDTRSPKIIARAVHRRKIFPTLDKYIFPELMKGVPKPINDDSDYLNNAEYVADLTMKGFPVSQGVARGYARVAMTLEEAEHLKPGEILITYSTDIGWSPYFPVLAGVVTELGGLVSHGAVISREYGLPCVVGLQGATRQFKTGDFVLLDGNRGTLQRLPPTETS